MLKLKVMPDTNQSTFGFLCGVDFRPTGGFGHHVAAGSTPQFFGNFLLPAQGSGSH